MRVFRMSDYQDPHKLARDLVQRPSGLEGIRERAREIIDMVRQEGDEALFRLTRELDGVDLESIGLRVPEEEIRSSERKVSGDFAEAVRLSARNITAFHRQQAREPWFRDTEEGLRVGYMVRPLERVGIYVPGGAAAYPSTALMAIIPAKVAGVHSIAVCSPPDRDGGLDPHLLYVLHYLKIYEAYRLGGAQAVAAMACGTDSIRAVDKVVGPGNLYVSLAKLELFGQVGVDFFAGPSEVVILADRQARPELLALDLLAQAEHSSGARSIIIAEDPQQMEMVERELEKAAARLYGEGDRAASMLEGCCGVVVDRLEDGVELVNIIAPEHLQIYAEDFNRHLNGVRNAGTILLGKDSPVCLGDYVAGTNHILPTSGNARFASPLGVADFLKSINVVYSNEKANRRLLHAVEALAEVEGMKAHALSLRMRVGHPLETLGLSESGGGRDA